MNSDTAFNNTLAPLFSCTFMDKKATVLYLKQNDGWKIHISHISSMSLQADIVPADPKVIKYKVCTDIDNDVSSSLLD